jgi:periplasmic protein CpxP/Spy
MSSNRFLKIVILILILINLGTLAFIWFSRPMRTPDGRRAVAAGFIVRELNLSEAQRREYRSMRINHLRTLEVLQEHDKMLHEQFFRQLFAEVPDMQAVADLADSIALNRKEMEILTYDHFRHLQHILTPEQQKRFKDIFDDVLKIVLPPPPSPPPPPPPQSQGN